jgi:hypothetical protein
MAPRLALDAGEGVREMRTADIIAIVAALISFGSMIGTVISARTARKNARIAEEAKNQAKQAALLGPRGEAINYVHAAVAALNRGQSSNTRGELIQNIQKAKQLADRVFSVEMRTELNDKLKAAQSLSDDPAGWGSLIAELENLIARMNAEAQLGGRASG